MIFFSALWYFKVNSTMTLKEPNVLVHNMQGTGGGKDSICWREFMEDRMKCTCQVDDIVTVRMYDRVVKKEEAKK